MYLLFQTCIVLFKNILGFNENCIKERMLNDHLFYF